VFDKCKRKVVVTAKTTEMKVSFAALVHTESEPPFTGSSLISFVFSVHVYVLACMIDCFEKKKKFENL
jgi:hypothetical protein